jgi:hypothetical protein
MDVKRVAMIIGITILLPLFIGLFFDALYPTPEYNDYCNYIYPEGPTKAVPPNTCPEFYSTAQAQECSRNEGEPRFTYDANGCQVFDKCDYCNKEYRNAEEVYNRNLFFILAPVGLAIVIIGIYFTVEYMGAGFMFGGLITLFYATVRYFSDMSKMLRALVILVELLIILWLGYRKIGPGDGKKPAEKEAAPAKKAARKK